MSTYFHFNVNPNWLSPRNPGEISITTFIQMYENIADQVVKIDKDDLAAKGNVADAISQIIDIMNEIKKWEVSSQFHDMKVEYVSIMTDHYTTLTRELSSDRSN